MLNATELSTLKWLTLSDVNFASMFNKGNIKDYKQQQQQKLSEAPGPEHNTSGRVTPTQDPAHTVQVCLSPPLPLALTVRALQSAFCKIPQLMCLQRCFTPCHL